MSLYARRHVLFVGAGILLASVASKKAVADIDLLSLPGPWPSSVKDGAQPFLKAARYTYQTYGQCRAHGGTDDDCRSVASMCTLGRAAGESYMKYVPAGGVAGKVKLFDSFKMFECENECFYCCVKPDGSCHSSFGPVPNAGLDPPAPNCSPGIFGMGTHTIGHAMLLDNFTHTDACLFYPQVCEGYAQCAYPSGAGFGAGPPPPKDPYAPHPSLDGAAGPPPSSSSSSSSSSGGSGGGSGSGTARFRIDWYGPSLHSDTSPPVAASWSMAPDKLALSKDEHGERARAFGESIVVAVYNYLENAPPDDPQDEITDFLSLRGSDAASSMQIDLAPFKTGKESAAVADIVARRRAAVMLGTLRVLGGIPNIVERFEWVSSRLWPAQEFLDYFAKAGITDPDAELEKTMGPVGLRILKQATGIADYRLLAVPRPGETPAKRVLGGAPLGDAPDLAIAAEPQSGPDFTLDVKMPARSPAMIAWGDGCVSNVADVTKVTHRYASKGVYRLTAIAGSTTSGLRTVAALVAEAKEADPSASCAKPYYRVTVPKAAIRAGGLQAGGRIGFTIEQRASDADVQMLGRTAATSFGTGDTSLGDFVGYSAPTAATKLVLRADMFDIGASLIFHDNRAIDVLLGDIVFERISGSQTAHLTAQTVVAFYRNAPETPVAVTLSDDGRVVIPLQPSTSTNGNDPTMWLDRIEIDVATLSAGGDAVVPSLPASGIGQHRRWKEDVPGSFVVVAEDARTTDGGSTPSSAPPSSDAPPDSPSGCSCAFAR